MSREVIGIPADAKPWVEKPVSPTAASAWKPLFSASGKQPHRVTLGIAGGGFKSVLVDAVTGDDAAAGALISNVGWKVVHVAPASAADGTADSSLVIE